MLKPSDIHPSLTDSRIDEIGHLIARVREDNLEAVDYRDNGWSIGCRAHAWICNELIEYAEQSDWLSIQDPSLRFIAKIDDVEISFYKGLADKPKKNIFSRAQSFPELKQTPLFPDIPAPEKLVWVYAVETDLEGETTNIEFVGLTPSGDVIASKTVPLFVQPQTFGEVSSNEMEAAELPEAPVSLPNRKIDKATNSEDYEE